MPRSRYRIHETEYPYFLTCTVVGWLPVFTRPEAVQIVFDCWDFLRQNREFVLYGYVAPENHLHLIAAAPDLTNAMKSFKMFTAKAIIELLERHSAEMLPRQLRALKLRHKTRSEYQVWQEGSHPKQIGNDEIMRQKLEYIHYNPVKRGYVDEPVHWRYSSARNYADCGACSTYGGIGAETRNRSFADGIPEQEFGNEGIRRLMWVGANVGTKTGGKLCQQGRPWQC